MSLNHMADWFDEEYEAILGLKHIPNPDYNPTIPPAKDDRGILFPIDWRNKNNNTKNIVAVTPVKDRTKWRDPGGNIERCAASYAVVVAEFLEGYQAVTKRKLAPVSVQ